MNLELPQPDQEPKTKSQNESYRNQRRTRQRQRRKTISTVRSLILDGDITSAASLLATGKYETQKSKRGLSSLLDTLVEAAVFDISLRDEVFRPLLIALVTGKKISLRHAQVLDQSIENRVLRKGLNTDPESEKIVHFVRSAAMRTIIDGLIGEIKGVDTTAIRVLKNSNIPGPEYPGTKNYTKGNVGTSPSPSTPHLPFKGTKRNAP